MMLKSVIKSTIVFIKLLFSWILLFDFMRLLYSIHIWDKFSDISIWEWFGVFTHSIRIDLATAVFLTAIPFLLYTFYSTFGKKVFSILFIAVLAIELISVLLIYAGEINVYPEWNHKLSTRVFNHLSNPAEIGKTATWGMTLAFLVYGILGAIFFKKTQAKFFKDKMHISVGLRSKMGFAFGTILSLCAGIILFRGGFQQIPLNIDSAYYSTSLAANDVSINSVYYFGKSYLQYRDANVEEFVPKVESRYAEAVIKELYLSDASKSQKILSTERPNVVIIVLESWTANAISSITNNVGVTPYFDSISKEGVLFRKIYATGTTSEIGNGSIFSGFPALPETSMTMQPEKHRKISSISEMLKNQGYYNSYLFSGDLKYGNINSYLMQHGFDKTMDEQDFPSGLRKGKLNYYDEDLYQIFLEEINKNSQPFLQCAFTGSTHSPYDYPKDKKQNYKGEQEDFMNSLIYADDCLNNFFKKAKQQAWYANTLFVLVADHGHSSPAEDNVSRGKYFNVPLLFYGDVIKKEYRGLKVDKIGAQNDLATTLLNQMGLETVDFPWSKDLLNPTTKSFAFHGMIRGYGWVSPGGNLSYNFDLKNFIDKNYSPRQLKEEKSRAEAYFYSLYQYYSKL
jgi:phosphoglycerol transferase MdoB-like AlkP superfamily enzyme